MYHTTSVQALVVQPYSYACQHDHVLRLAKGAAADCG
jgi:hypothetical protein